MSPLRDTVPLLQLNIVRPPAEGGCAPPGGVGGAAGSLERQLAQRPTEGELRGSGILKPVGPVAEAHAALERAQAAGAIESSLQRRAALAAVAPHAQASVAM